MERVRSEFVAGLRRFWPALILVALMALFDYHLKGQLWFTLLAGGGASMAMLFYSRFQRLIEPLIQSVPSGFIRPLLTAVPVAFLYLARWKGTQDDSSALLTAVVIVGFAFLVAMYRQQINERLTPFYIERNRLLSRPVRMALVFVVPILLTFLLVHRNLGDVGALLGGTTSSPRSPAGGNEGFMIVVTTALSACAVFLLLNEPTRQPEQASQSGGIGNG
jgi:preprotein translocase subunit SecG